MSREVVVSDAGSSRWLVVGNVGRQQAAVLEVDVPDWMSAGREKSCLAAAHCRLTDWSNADSEIHVFLNQVQFAFSRDFWNIHVSLIGWKLIYLFSLDLVLLVQPVWLIYLLGA